MKRLLIVSVAVNLIAAAVIVGLNGRDVEARLRQEPPLMAGLARAPQIPYRAEHRLSMTRVEGGLTGVALERWRREILAGVKSQDVV